jgi:outer membrane murein-binding lipoprotein Lpp
MRKLLIVLVVAGLTTCSGCASLDLLLGRTNEVSAKLEVLEQQVDSVATGWKNVESMTAEQKAELVDQTLATQQQIKQTQADLQNMGTAGVIAGGAYLVIRHVLPRVGGPLGSILSLVLQALVRKKEDDGSEGTS